MGGKRIAEQIRRALITAAKMGPIVVSIDTTGCFYSKGESCSVVCPPEQCHAPDASAPDAAARDASKDGR